MSDYYITASSKSAKKSAESPKLSETSPSDEVDTASDVDGSSVSIEDEQTDDEADAGLFEVIFFSK